MKRCRSNPIIAKDKEGYSLEAGSWKLEAGSWYVRPPQWTVSRILFAYALRLSASSLA